MLVEMGLLGFLKFASIMGVAGLSVNVLGDLHKAKVINLGGLFQMVTKVKGFNLDKEHTTVLGLTRHGKTYATLETLKGLKQSVFFFNVQHEKVPADFITASQNNTPSQILNALREGKKINYLPDSDIDNMQKELSNIIKHMYNRGSNWNCRFVIDEVHLMKKEALKDCIRIATTGLRHEIYGVFISQRPANVDNTLYSQSTKHIIFALGKVDERYLKEQGFPIETIVEKTRNEKYNFVTFDQKEIKGAFRV